MAKEGAERDASSRGGDQRLPEFPLLASDSQPVASSVKKHLTNMLPKSDMPIIPALRGSGKNHKAWGQPEVYMGMLSHTT